VELLNESSPSTARCSLADGANSCSGPACPRPHPAQVKTCLVGESESLGGAEPTSSPEALPAKIVGGLSWTGMQAQTIGQGFHEVLPKVVNVIQTVRPRDISDGEALWTWN
jgi:hypothetical protein